MAFRVGVSVLSVQTAEAFSIILQELRIRLKSFLAVIRCVAKESARVTASGSVDTRISDILKGLRGCDTSWINTHPGKG